MTKQSFISILRQIVIDYPYVKHGRLSSFLYTTEDNDVDKKLFGATHDKYLQNQFWSRAWSDGGAVQGEIAIDFPIMFVESVKSSVELDTMKQCSEISVALFDQKTCDCCTRSFTEIEKDLERVMSQVINEAKKYNLYQYVQGNETKSIWCVPQRKPIGGVKKGNAKSYIEANKSLNFNVILSIENKIGVMTTLKICGCDSANIDFNYSNNALPIECDVC